MRLAPRCREEIFMKIAFVVPNAPGHLNPMTTLARRLQSRNHDVVVMSFQGAAPLVRAADLSFVPCGDEELPAERLNLAKNTA